MQYGKHEDSHEISYQVMAPLQLSSPWKICLWETDLGRSPANSSELREVMRVISDHVEDASCGSKFENSSGLSCHKQEPAKSYTCTFCNQEFEKSSNLNGHLRVHTEDELHTCSYCTKMFTLWPTLLIGTQIPQSLASLHRQTCCQCGKIILATTSLKTHLKVFLHYPDCPEKRSLNHHNMLYMAKRS